MVHLVCVFYCYGRILHSSCCSFCLNESFCFMLKFKSDILCVCVHADHGAPHTTIQSLRIPTSSNWQRPERCLVYVQHSICTVVCVCACTCKHHVDVVLCLCILMHQQFRETLPDVFKFIYSKSSVSMSHLVLCGIQMSVLPIISWYVWLKPLFLLYTLQTSVKGQSPTVNHI